MMRGALKISESGPATSEREGERELVTQRSNIEDAYNKAPSTTTGGGELAGRNINNYNN